jgi:NAD(P)-dependent dehydrogenase (short-subunit alcohol dehydrogenase family)
MSSGAALAGSPLSGGYAGAKATIRLIAGYAADESERHGLDIRVISVLPRLTPATGLGSTAVSAYARRENLDIDTYVARLGRTVTVEDVGAATADIVRSPEYASGAYLLTAEGLAPLH